MWGWLMTAIGVFVLGGCEAPSDPAPAAQFDPLEDAIARGRFPDPIANLLRRLSTLPQGSPVDAALDHLGLTDEPDEGVSLLGQDSMSWDVAPGYRVDIVVDTDPRGGGPPHVSYVSVAAARVIGNPAAGSVQVVPYWSGGRLYYD